MSNLEYKIGGRTDGVEDLQATKDVIAGLEEKFRFTSDQNNSRFERIEKALVCGPPRHDLLQHVYR